MEGQGPRQGAFSGEPKATACSRTGNREPGATARTAGTGNRDQDGERQRRATVSRPACWARLAVRRKGHCKPPAFNLRGLPELCHCPSKDRVVASALMAALRRSPSHAEGGMFMLPPKHDRPDPYGRAAGGGARGEAQPARPPPPGPSVPPPHRTHLDFSGQEQNRTPFSSGRCGRRGPDPGPKGEGVAYRGPGTPMVRSRQEEAGWVAHL
jgi:hypothetical protein